MFLVPTYLQKSNISGLGVFAARKIKKGEIIWYYIGGLEVRVTSEQIKKYDKVIQDFLKKYTYTEIARGKTVYILSPDDSRFINSADNANCIVKSRKSLAASRNINKGEEITNDYSSFDLDYKRKFKIK